MMTPGQVSSSLNVSTATVRRWSNRFARHLSPQTPNRKRTYTPDDLAILARVRDMSEKGSSLDQVDTALSMVAPDPSTALLSLSDFAKSLLSARDAVAMLKIQLDQQNAQIQIQNAQIRAIADWLAMPSFKRLFVKPPRLDL
jgi:DNA-binding transcriptional MerR regulator